MKRAFLRGRWTAVLGVVALFLLVPLPGHSAVPTTVGYQGSLTDPAGTPVNTTLPMVFSLYDAPAAATPLWSETQSVTVTNGIFSVRLGSVTPFPANLFTGPRFLGVKVDTDPEMTPRLPFDAAPFAFSAEQLVACAPGQTNCAGTCVDLQSDTSNCGTCGTVCAGAETCIGGACTLDPDDDDDGWTVGAGDCNDADPEINPDAPEVCNDVDDDCDDIIDESGAVGETEWFADADADSFGDPSISTFACSQPPGTVPDGSDCDDADPEINPGAPEICNGVDDNCNASVDEGADASCGDGSLCTTDVCASGACQNTPLDCSGISDACNVGACDEGTGACVPQAVADGTACDDADACSVADQCQAGACAGGAPLDCGVSTVCATRFCDSATGCGVTYAPAGIACGTGLVCNGSGSCVPL